VPVEMGGRQVIHVTPVSLAAYPFPRPQSLIDFGAATNNYFLQHMLDGFICLNIEQQADLRLIQIRFIIHVTVYYDRT
jgi:hypothetical protein